MEPSEEKVMEQAAKELGITQLVPTIYQDLLQPAVKESGQQFVVVARAVGIALAPLEGAVWGYQQIKDYLAAKVAARLANKPPEEIKAPDRVIAGPVVMGMAFASEAPHLREMYANLLAAAMHSPSANRVHPSFVQIVQQLAPAEAQILKHIAGTYSSGAVLFREDLANLESPESESLTRVFVIHNYLAARKTNISQAWQKLCTNCGTTDSVLANAFFRNFTRLGILDERIENATKGGRSGVQFYLQMGGVSSRKLVRKVELTEYGNLFLDVCVRDK